MRALVAMDGHVDVRGYRELLRVAQEGQTVGLTGNPNVSFSDRYVMITRKSSKT